MASNKDPTSLSPDNCLLWKKANEVEISCPRRRSPKEWCEHLLQSALQMAQDTIAHRQLALSRNSEKRPVVYLYFVRDVSELHCAELCFCVGLLRSSFGGWYYKMLTWWLMCVLGPGTIPGLSAGWDEARGLSAPSLHTAMCLWEQSGRDAPATIWTQTAGKEGRGGCHLLAPWRFVLWGCSGVGWQEVQW